MWMPHAPWGLGLATIEYRYSSSSIYCSEPLHSLLLAFRIGRRRLFVELGAWHNILRERDACQAQTFGNLHVDLALASDTLTEGEQVGTARQRGRSIREDVVRPCLQALD